MARRNGVADMLDGNGVGAICVCSPSKVAAEAHVGDSVVLRRGQ